MAWNLLKKSHLTQRPTPAPPLLSHAEDRELDVIVQRLMHIEETVRKLTKETKRYLESMDNLDRADQRLSANLSTCDLAHTNDEFRKIVEEYHSVTTQVGKNVQETMALCQKTFIEPLKKLRDLFAIIAEALAKREELVATWKCTYNRLKKLQERKDRTASHIAKVERERRIEEAAAKELKNCHSQLLIDFPAFLDKSTMELFAQLMSQKSSSSPERISTNDDEYQKKITEQFNRIRGLTIVKDD